MERDLLWATLWSAAVVIVAIVVLLVVGGPIWLIAALGTTLALMFGVIAWLLTADGDE